MRLQLTLEKIASKPQSLFLIDGLGALLSVFLLGVLLPNFESTFGMPKATLFFLASLPCIFVTYDFFCFLKIHPKQDGLVNIIAVANLIYSFVSLTMVIYHFHELSLVGLIYFLLEIAIVLTLAVLELKIASIMKHDLI